MKKYKVYIYVDDKLWGDYEVYSRDRDSAAFVAGMKYQAEKVSRPWDFITCAVCQVVMEPES